MNEDMWRSYVSYYSDWLHLVALNDIETSICVQMRLQEVWFYLDSLFGIV